MYPLSLRSGNSLMEINDHRFSTQSSETINTVRHILARGQVFRLKTRGIIKLNDELV